MRSVMIILLVIVVVMSSFFLFIADSRIVAGQSLESQVSLQALIDQTPENGTLQLENKVYAGNVTITKPITIIGAGKTVIKGDGTDNVILIKSSDVILDRLIIQHSGQSRNTDEEYSGVRVLDSDYNAFLNLDISDIYHGIYLSRSNHNVISHVTITGHGKGKLAMQGNGINVVRSKHNTIEYNTITKTRDGIYFEYSDDSEINYNIVSETRYGLHYMYSSKNRFIENEFVRNIGGAAIMSSSGILLEGNKFSFNKGTRSFGLIIQTSRDNHVINNEFFLNQRGVFFDQATANRVEKNKFYQNDIGVEIWSTAIEQVFVENHFTDNKTAVVSLGPSNANRWHENGKGNYWGKSVPLLDLDQDLIGDFPVEYKSSLHKLIEQNELIYLFLKSPAITLYEKMNALLNQQDVMVEDEYPLLVSHGRSSNWYVWGFPVAGGFIWWGYRRRSKQ